MRAWDLTTGKQLDHWGEHDRFIDALAFCPETGLLYSGSNDSTVMAWHVSAWRRGAATRLSWLPSGRVAALWEDLASAQGDPGLRATWTLTDHPSQAAGLLRPRLLPAVPPPPARLAELIADLDGPPFAGRERAADELAPGEALGVQSRYSQSGPDPSTAPVFVSRPPATVRRSFVLTTAGGRETKARLFAIHGIAPSFSIAGSCSCPGRAQESPSVPFRLCRGASRSGGPGEGRARRPADPRGQCGTGAVAADESVQALTSGQ